jgi:hypothetical protein
MKALTSIPLFIIIFTLAGHSSADQWVNGYSKSDGTYVQGHYRSSPDSYRYNNRNSQSNGGSQRDEYSSGMGATNRSNPSWGYRDNDNDGISNSFDSSPESKSNCIGVYCD